MTLPVYNARMNTLVRFIVALGIPFAILGCDSKPATNTAVTEAPKSTATPLGITADCVICIDHPIEVMSDTAKKQFNGKDYYFCSDECAATFEKDPAAALAKYEAKKKPATTPSN